MGNKISTTQKPVIMTFEFLKDKVIKDTVNAEDIDLLELQKLVEIDGIEYDVIFSLDLEHQSLVNIDDLWRFKLLTKLEMPNNLLERIEGLECLLNLQILDLSFNYIKGISGLENLINLIQLNLTSNEIILLENMESLKKLETFCIRHNKIKSFDNVFYLSQFKSLSCLALGKNPLIQDDDTVLHIIAVLPCLKYLDFAVVTANQLKKALKKFPPADKVLEDFKGVSDERDDKTLKCPFQHSDKDAYVDNLANGQGFQFLLRSDKRFHLLYSFPPASCISEDHYSKISQIFDEWHETGHQYYELIQQEKLDFLFMISKAKLYTLDVAREEIPAELCMIYQNNATDYERDYEVAEFKKNCESCLLNTYRNFMHSTCLSVDLISNMCKIYEKEISLINTKYMQEVEKCIEDIIDISQTFSLQLQEFYFELYDSGFDFTKDIKTEEGILFEISPEFLQLIQKKEIIALILELSNRIHAVSLDGRISDLKSTLQQDMEETIDQAMKEAFLRQSEQMRHTVVFCSKQKHFLDKLFSKNNIFKHYLGYR